MPKELLEDARRDVVVVRLGDLGAVERAGISAWCGPKSLVSYNASKPVTMLGFGDMEIHEPKPWHGWRGFLKEYGIIVLGVLTALGLEQCVEALHWHHKVDQAEQNMRIELAADRTEASQYAILAPCTQAYLDRVRDDLLRHNHADLARLYRFGEPFITEPWTATAWDAAVASQIGDHMATDRFLNYAEAFRRAELMKDVQFRLRDHFVAAMVGQFELAAGQGQADQLTAAEDLRRDITLSGAITNDFIANTDALKIMPDAGGVSAYRRKADDCVAALRSIERE